MKSDLTPAMGWQNITDAQLGGNLDPIASRWCALLDEITTREQARASLDQARMALLAMPELHRDYLMRACRPSIDRVYQLAAYTDEERRAARR